MSLNISAADANRQFSAVLRQVREGRTFTVTSHDRPVARIVPVRAEANVTAAARAALFRRLRGAKVQPVGRWRREDLYEDGRERRD
ncbi:MAG TPA: type II toxin-antitoxin system prevent-host-death family antitoxin [Vicinamibacterales bacterium]|nr:type II toxin-antitoxin system prevent-host-death family antitoxin [Vicinamibacterales bacterium]